YQVIKVLPYASEEEFVVWRLSNPIRTSGEWARALADIDAGRTPAPTSLAYPAQLGAPDLDNWFVQQLAYGPDRKALLASWRAATDQQKWELYLSEQGQAIREARVGLFAARNPFLSQDEFHATAAHILDGTDTTSAELAAVSGTDVGDALVTRSVQGSLLLADESMSAALTPEASFAQVAMSESGDQVFASAFEAFATRAGAGSPAISHIASEIASGYEAAVARGASGSDAVAAALASVPAAQESMLTGSVAAAESASGIGAEAALSAVRATSVGLGVLGVMVTVAAVVDAATLVMLPLQAMDAQLASLAVDANAPEQIDRFVSRYASWVPDLHADLGRVTDATPTPMATVCAPEWVVCSPVVNPAEATLPLASSMRSMFYAVVGASLPGVDYNCAQASLPPSQTVQVVSAQTALQRLLPACVPPPAAALRSAPSATDPVMVAQAQGSAVVHRLNAVPVMDWTGAVVNVAVAGHWFVQASAGHGGQTLRLPYVDWSGGQRLATLVFNPMVGHTQFLSTAVDSASAAVTPNGCAASHACAVTDVLEVFGPQGVRYTVGLAPPRPPVLTGITVSANPVEGAATTFTADGASDNIGPMSYTWTFPGDGGPTTDSFFGDSVSEAVASAHDSVRHAFTRAGAQTATVRVTDARGASTVVTVPVQVANRPPVVSITGIGTWTTTIAGTAPGVGRVAAGVTLLRLGATITDPGINDATGVTVTWCDGSQTILNPGTAIYDPTDPGFAMLTRNADGSRTLTVNHAAMNTTGCRITVQATDGIGGGGTSSVAVPGAPAPVTLDNGNAFVRVHFTPGPLDPTATASVYVITSQDVTTGAQGPTTAVLAPTTDGGVLGSTFVPAAALTGLVNGHTYVVTVTARDGLGASEPATSAPITVGAPSAPTGMAASSGCITTPGVLGGASTRDCLATLGFTAATGNGAPVTGYTLTVTRLIHTAGVVINTGVGSAVLPAGVQTQIVATRALTATEVAGHTATVAGLTSGQQYEFTLTATNVLGVSPGAVCPFVVSA
ncbi:MAG: PKD domain-containing protein, partial [Actinomycetota bacterium]|nr:PKD domain-containing protein [Actinomycetota bacterium]